MVRKEPYQVFIIRLEIQNLHPISSPEKSKNHSTLVHILLENGPEADPPQVRKKHVALYTAKPQDQNNSACRNKTIHFILVACLEKEISTKALGTQRST